jgi:chromosome segregation ATPase
MQKTPQLFQTTHISPVKKQQPYLTLPSRPDTPEDGSIKVFIRLRPSSPQQQTGEGEQCVKLEDTNDANTTSHSLTLLSSSEPTTYTYDHIAPPDTTQDQVFKAVGRPMVDHVLAGFNASILCYGQTSSGKTYTMLGELPATTGLHRDGYKSICHMPENAGLIPRIVHHLFEELKKEQQEAEDEAGGGGGDGDTSASNKVTYTVRCAMLEIYKEEISDLLASHAVHGTTPGPTATGTAAVSTTTNKLLIREDAKGVVVDGLTWTNVTSEEAALKVLTRGAAARRVAETRANARSSRSHCVFSCWLESRSSSCSSPTSPEAAAAGGGLSSNKNTVVRTAMLHMVDLAGSERQSTAGTEGERLKEAAAINKSLLTLGLVINKLADTAGSSTGVDESSSAHVHQQQQHIPYRSSKLTHLLKESLGGNARSIVIATISPSSACASETASTLAFAARAGRVKNKPKINENVTVNAAVLARDNKRLKAELAAAMTMNTEKAASRAAYAELEAARDQNNALEYSVAELKERLAAAEAGRAVMENEIAALKAQMVEANDARLEAAAAKSDALERCNDLEMMEQMLKSQLETLREEKYELDQAHSEVINTLGRYKGDKESLMEQLEEMTAEKQQLAATLAATRENQAGVAAETDKQRAEVAILRAELAGVRAELSLKQDANTKLAIKLLQHESDSTSSFVVVAGDTSPAPSKNSSKAIQTSNSAPPKAKREIDNAAVNTSSPSSNNATEQLKDTALKLEAKLYGSEKLQKELEQQCATLTVERDAATQRVSDLEAQLVESQQYADGLMGDAADAAQHATAAICELDMLKANFAVEKEAALSSLNDKLTRTKEELVRVHLNSQRSIDAADERIAALKAELATALCRKQVNSSSSAAGVVADVEGKSDTNASMNSSKAGMKILKTELEAQKEAVLKMEALLAHRERKLEIATSQWSKAKEEISTLTKRLHASQDEAAEFETELSQVQQQLSVVEKEKAELKAANDAAGDDEKKEEEAMAAAATKHMEEIERLSTGLIAAEERAVQAEHAVANLAAKVDDLEQGLEVRTQQLNAHETAVSILETRLELTQSNNAACIKELETQVSHLKRIVEERAAAVKAGELRAARLEDELTAAKSQLAAHKDLAEQRDQACLDLENDLSSIERQHEALKQTASHAELSLADMTAKVAVCESRIKDLESDVESKEWRVNDLQAQVVDLKEALFSSTSDLQAAQQCVEELSTDVEARDWRIKDLSTQLANLKCAVNTMEGIKMELEAHTAELEKEVREYQGTVQHLKEQLSLVAEGTQRDADEGQAALLVLKDRVKSLSEHAARRDAEVEQLKVTMRKNIAQELDAARQAHSAALEEAVKTHAEAEAAATAKVHRLKSAAEQAKKTVETLKVQLEEAELARRYAMQQSAHQLKEVDAKRAAAEVAGATQAANLQRQLAVLSSKHKKAAAERDAVTDALKALKDAFQDSEHRHKEGRKMLEQKVDALRKEVELTREALMVAEAAQLTGCGLTEREEELEEEHGTPEAASPQKNMGKIALGGGMLRPLVLNDNNDDDDELEEKTPEGRNIEEENSENSGPVQLPLNTPIGWGFAYQRRYLDENTPPPGGMSPSKKRILEARGPLAARSQQVAMMNIMGNE